MDEILKEIDKRQDLAYEYFQKTKETIHLQKDRNKLMNLKSIQDTTIEYLLGIIEKLKNE